MAELPSAGSVIAGRYRIEALLGEGGMGAVLAAIDTTTGAQVAIKWVRPSSSDSAEAVARFVDEARATAKIVHPNVVRVFDVGREGQAPFFVMERLEGESLRARLRRTGALGVVETLEIAIGVCSGLSEAHRQGVIHRDLKPDNVFLCASGPKVLDFGVAKLRERVGGSLTKTGVALGTPSYMSPEQIGAPRQADPRFDVYALGVVLYEMLSGRLPYEGSDFVVLVRQIAEGMPPSLRRLAPDVPRRLEAIVLRAMSADRDARYATMDALAAELETVRSGYAATIGAMPSPMRAAPGPEVSTAVGHGTAQPPMTPASVSQHAVHAPITPAPASQRAAAYAPMTPAPASQRAPAPRTPAPSRPRATSDPARTKLLLIAGVLVALPMLCLVPAGLAGMWLALSRGSAPVVRSQPRGHVPPAAMSLQGIGCAASFVGPVHVQRWQTGLMVSGDAGGVRVSILITSTLPPPRGGQIPFGEAFLEHGFQVQVTNHPDRTWVNNTLLGAVAGAVAIDAWDPANGRARIEFFDATLVNANGGGPCVLDGTLIAEGFTP